MAQQAKVTSVDAIDAFRAQLIVYLSKARPTLEEVAADVSRLRQWLENDQRRFWEREIKERRKKLERAQAELFSAMMSKMREVSAAQQMAVRHAQDAVREAESRIAALKRWERELENRSEPLLKQVDALHNYLITEMPRAVAYLTQVLKSLEAYAAVQPAGKSAAPPPAAAAPESPGGEKPS